jgi:hypothetical protein
LIENNLRERARRNPIVRRCHLFGFLGLLFKTFVENNMMLKNRRISF